MVAFTELVLLHAHMVQSGPELLAALPWANLRAADLQPARASGYSLHFILLQILASYVLKVHGTEFI